MELTIRRAELSEIGKLSELAMRSKQSNGYDDAFMEQCRAELTLTASDFNSGEYWVAVSHRIVGSVGLQIGPSEHAAEIVAFFVDTDCQGQGVGRALWHKVLGRAIALGIREIQLDSDPGAVPFYENLGFSTVGLVPSGSVEGRKIPQMLLFVETVT
ncbi:MAG: GNAT family N-acetyltransferase [Rhodobacteraceae bacterium]|nr:GNAT family N-acetyltransferase [Paracoccaceae bacterium]